MARGHKTGGRQKGTPNKRKAQAAGQATAGLAPSEIASMMPVDVMLFSCLGHSRDHRPYQGLFVATAFGAEINERDPFRDAGREQPKSRDSSTSIS
jgi:hypothetical protein